MTGDIKIIKIVRPFWKIGARGAKADAQGSAPSADELQRRYLRPVLHYVAGRVGINERADAEDITAEVFAAAFTFLHKCPVPNAENDVHPSDGGSDPVRAWLFGIARRKIADYFRRRACRPQTIVSEAQPAPSHQEPEPALLADEAYQTLYDLLAHLPEPQREAIYLRYLDGLNVDDIAQVLNKSPNATAQLLHRARQTLRTRGAAYFDANEATKPRK